MLKNPSKTPPTPSTEEVEKYLKQWETNEVYNYSQKSLNNLFETFPNNKNLNEIIVKVCTLDVVFSANTSRWFFEVSKHILNYDFDNKLKKGELDVNDFALVKVLDKKNNKIKTRNFYSFASKYCSHHKPLDYPIYDSYVDYVLRYFMPEELNKKKDSLKNYVFFKATLNDFRNKYNLGKYDLKQIDEYIWLLGKEFFRN